MGKDNTFDFAAYRKGVGNRVPCPRCGRPIPADSTQCPECRVHFDGIAAEFAPGARDGSSMLGRWAKVGAWLILGILAIGLLMALAAHLLGE